MLSPRIAVYALLAAVCASLLVFVLVLVMPTVNSLLPHHTPAPPPAVFPLGDDGTFDQPAPEPEKTH